MIVVLTDALRWASRGQLVHDLISGFSVGLSMMMMIMMMMMLMMMMLLLMVV